MPSVPEDLNVYRRPHGHMMKLVKDIEREVGRPNMNTTIDNRDYVTVVSIIYDTTHYA